MIVRREPFVTKALRLLLLRAIVMVSVIPTNKLSNKCNEREIPSHCLFNCFI